MITLNPGGIVNEFIYFCDAIASWLNPPQDLQLMIQKASYILVNKRLWQHF